MFVKTVLMCRERDTQKPKSIGDVNYQYYQTSGLKTMKMEASTVYGKATRTSGEYDQIH